MLLTTHNLAVGYGRGKHRTTLLSGLNLSLAPGEMVALLGKNGVGKSTLLRALTISTPPHDGTITIDGQDASTLSPRQLSRLIGLVATTRAIAGALTVEEIVALGRQPHTGLLGRLDSHDRDIVNKAMTDAGIAHKANNNIQDLSDGERQKAMIARALAQETPIIILDEPTAFLDVASRIETMQLLHSLAHEHNKAVLLSSHDIAQSLMLADRLWLITRDRQLIADTPERITASGAMNRVFDNPAITFSPTLHDYLLQSSSH